MGALLPLLFPNRGLCMEPAIFRLADLLALERGPVAQRMRSSACEFEEGGGLHRIEIAVGSFSAHISRRFIRYVAFQWLNTTDKGRLKVCGLRDVLRIVFAATLSDELHSPSTVLVGQPRNFMAMP
jgi:hypothetical protein